MVFLKYHVSPDVIWTVALVFFVLFVLLPLWVAFVVEFPPKISVKFSPIFVILPTLVALPVLVVLPTLVALPVLVALFEGGCGDGGALLVTLALLLIPPVLVFVLDPLLLVTLPPLDGAIGTEMAELMYRRGSVIPSLSPVK